MEIIYKNSLSSPYFSYEIAPFSCLDKYISSITLLEGITLPVSYAGFYYWNVTIFFCYVSQSIQRKFLSINSESFILVHVVNISPYCVER